MLNKMLKSLRESYNNISQKDLAEKIGISRERYNQYETGKRNPDYETLISLAKFFNVTTDYLLGYTDNKSGTINNTDNQLEDDDLKAFLKDSDMRAMFKDYDLWTDEEKQAVLTVLKGQKALRESKK